MFCFWFVSQPHPAHPAVAHPHPHTPMPQPSTLPVSVAAANAAAMVAMTGTAPCSTLFIANLGTNTSEVELRELASG